MSRQGAVVYKWTKRKNRDNKKKHGFYLSEATGVFDDPHLIEFYDGEHSSMDEDRYITIGQAEGMGVLVVVTTDNPDGVIQLITAREATPREQEAYYENYRKETGGN
jgi:uncharacterized DUF497 family protein